MRIEREREREGGIERQTGRQIARQRDRQIDRQIHRQTDGEEKVHYTSHPLITLKVEVISMSTEDHDSFHF